MAKNNNNNQGGGRNNYPRHNNAGQNQNRNQGNRQQNAAPAPPRVNVLLPKDTAELYRDMKYQAVENFHLRFNKYIKPSSKGNTYEWTTIFKSKEEQQKFLSFTPTNNASYAKVVEKTNKQLRVALDERKAEGHEVFTTQMKTVWRMVIGLGRESTLETSMTLHHIYGFPYIPSTSLKGIVRSYIILEYFGGKESLAMADQGFSIIFGSGSLKENSKTFEFPERRGSLIFYDAYPKQFSPEDNFKVDILNCHFQPYYSEGKPPADYHDPIPVNFLTVENCSFNFAFSINSNQNQHIGEGKFAGKTPYEVVKKEMVEALRNHGIGAKTSVGYGLFA